MVAWTQPFYVLPHIGGSSTYKNIETYVMLITQGKLESRATILASRIRDRRENQSVITPGPRGPFSIFAARSIILE